MGWRGDGTGLFDDKNAPIQWSDNLNIVWKTPTQTWSNASPIVVGDKVFVCEEPVTVVALDRKTGKVLWRKESLFLDTVEGDEHKKWLQKLADLEVLETAYKKERREINRLKQKARRQKADKNLKAEIKDRLKQLNQTKKKLDHLAHYRRPTPKDNIIGTSSPTPISDGRFVYAFFGNGVASKFSLNGKRIWSTWLGPSLTPMDGYDEGVAASPRLVGDKLILGYEGIRALDIDTGEELWKTERFTDFGTPVIFQQDDNSMVITASGSAVSTQDGSRLHGEKLPGLRYTGPIMAGDTLFVAGTTPQILDHRQRLRAEVGAGGAQHKAQVTAYQLQKDGAKYRPRILFRTPLPGERYYATAVADKNHVYAVQNTGTLSILDRTTGGAIAEIPLKRQLKNIFQEHRPESARNLPVGGEVFASPVLAGGNLYISFDTGLTVVLKTTPPFDIVAANRLPSGRASLFFHGGDLFVRTLDALYCFRNQR